MPKYDKTPKDHADDQPYEILPNPDDEFVGTGGPGPIELQIL